MLRVKATILKEVFREVSGFRRFQGQIPK